MVVKRLRRRLPGIAVGLIAFLIGLALVISGRPGVGYAVGVAVIGLLLALISTVRALR
jgi:hypothetical protein